MFNGVVCLLYYPELMQEHQCDEHWAEVFHAEHILPEELALQRAVVGNLVV